MTDLEKLRIKFFSVLRQELTGSMEEFEDIWKIYSFHFTSGVLNDSDMKHIVAMIMNKVAVNDIQRRDRLVKGMIYLSFEAISLMIAKS